MSDLTQIGRIAFRHEGDWWNAYYALPGSMDRAIHLGSVKFAGAVANQKVKQLFIQTMRELVADIIEENTGQRPTWKDPVPTPEHERAGSA